MCKKNIRLYTFELTYAPLDVNYEDKNFEFWNQGDIFQLRRTENIEEIGKFTAYEIVKIRANRYAKQLGIQLKFWVSTKELDYYYCSNTYLSKKPKIDS